MRLFPKLPEQFLTDKGDRFDRVDAWFLVCVLSAFIAVVSFFAAICSALATFFNLSTVEFAEYLALFILVVFFLALQRLQIAAWVQDSERKLLRSKER